MTNAQRKRQAEAQQSTNSESIAEADGPIFSHNPDSIEDFSTSCHYPQAEECMRSFQAISPPMTKESLSLQLALLQSQALQQNQLIADLTGSRSGVHESSASPATPIFESQFGQHGCTTKDGVTRLEI